MSNVSILPVKVQARKFVREGVPQGSWQERVCCSWMQQVERRGVTEYRIRQRIQLSRRWGMGVFVFCTILIYLFIYFLWRIDSALLVSVCDGCVGVKGESLWDATALIPHSDHSSSARMRMKNNASHMSLVQQRLRNAAIAAFVYQRVWRRLKCSRNGFAFVQQLSLYVLFC